METVTRKRLGKAVLLSLLLMNVCKLGGAAEYNAAITGNETDYDSIKEVDIVSGATVTVLVMGCANHV